MDKNKDIKQENLKLRKIALIVVSVLLIISGYFYYTVVYSNKEPVVIYETKKEVKEITKEKINVYLPDKKGDGLIVKEVEVETGANEGERIKNVFQVIKDNLSYDVVYTDKNGVVQKVPFIGEKVEVMDVFVDGSDIYLNMNYHFRDNMKTISQEIYVIYAIVNTLTEDSRYKRVKFLINNKEVDKLNFYNLSNFYEKNLDI